MSVETITIDTVTKYGGRVNGKNYNLSKNYTGPVLQALKTYEAEIYTSAQGAKYINKILREIEGVAERETVAVPTPAPTAPVAATNTHVYKARDFDKEARGKTRCALYEAALASPFLMQSKDSEEFKRRADELVAYFVSKVFED